MKESKESTTLEFKSSFNDETIETLTAFANSKGGKVLIGVDDKGIPIKGFVIGKETLQKWINEVKIKTQPTVIPDADIVKIQGVTIGQLSVKEFPIKPASFKGRYFKRVGNSNHQLSLTEISELHLKTFNLSWDNYITPYYSSKNISLEKVIDFINRCNKERDVPITDDPSFVLNKFELMNESGMTNACFLLFAKNDVFAATIELGRFSTPTSIKDGITIRCDLINEVDKVLDFIRKHINKEYIITGDPRREERWQYPMPAIREIVINMIVHRNYMDHGDSSIKIYNDRIEFYNPGKLPDELTVEQLLSGNYSSNARNKRVASIFKEAQLIEKYGSGIKRIRDGFAKYGLQPPLFEVFQSGFRVTVYSNPEESSEKTSGKSSVISTEKGTEKSSEKIETLISKNPKITTKEMAVRLNISPRAVEKQIKNLKTAGKLERIGPDRGGYWKVKEDN